MTLVEIIVVITLIILVMSFVMSGVLGKKDEAVFKLNQIKMTNLQQALESYRLDYNRYPSSLEDLLRPSADTKGKPFIPKAKDEDLKDSWGNSYVFQPENNGRSYRITSYGADGIPGGDGVKQDYSVTP